MFWLSLIALTPWLVAHSFYQELTQPETYVRVAQAQELEGKEVLIEVRIDWNQQRIEQAIRETFPATPNTAVAIAKAESMLNANAYNPEWHYDRLGNPVCQGSYGIMQIACVHHLEDPEALFDVQFNLQKAKQIQSNAGDWKDWGAYTDGRWEEYL